MLGSSQLPHCTCWPYCQIQDNPAGFGQADLPINATSFQPTFIQSFQAAVFSWVRQYSSGNSHKCAINASNVWEQPHMARTNLQEEWWSWTNLKEEWQSWTSLKEEWRSRTRCKEELWSWTNLEEEWRSQTNLKEEFQSPDQSRGFCCNLESQCLDGFQLFEVSFQVMKTDVKAIILALELIVHGTEQWLESSKCDNCHSRALGGVKVFKSDLHNEIQQLMENQHHDSHNGMENSSLLNTEVSCVWTRWWPLLDGCCIVGMRRHLLEWCGTVVLWLVGIRWLLVTVRIGIIHEFWKSHTASQSLSHHFNHFHISNNGHSTSGKGCYTSVTLTMETILRGVAGNNGFFSLDKVRFAIATPETLCSQPWEGHHNNPAELSQAILSFNPELFIISSSILCPLSWFHRWTLEKPSLQCLSCSCWISHGLVLLELHWQSDEVKGNSERWSCSSSYSWFTLLDCFPIQSLSGMTLFDRLAVSSRIEWQRLVESKLKGGVLSALFWSECSMNNSWIVGEPDHKCLIHIVDMDPSDLSRQLTLSPFCIVWPPLVEAWLFSIDFNCICRNSIWQCTIAHQFTVKALGNTLTGVCSSSQATLASCLSMFDTSEMQLLTRLHVGQSLKHQSLRRYFSLFAFRYSSSSYNHFRDRGQTNSPQLSLSLRSVLTAAWDKWPTQPMCISLFGYHWTNHNCLGGGTTTLKDNDWSHLPVWGLLLLQAGLPNCLSLPRWLPAFKQWDWNSKRNWDCISIQAIDDKVWVVGASATPILAAPSDHILRHFLIKSPEQITSRVDWLASGERGSWNDGLLFVEKRWNSMSSKEPYSGDWLEWWDWGDWHSSKQALKSISHPEQSTCLVHFNHSQRD